MLIGLAQYSVAQVPTSYTVETVNSDTIVNFRLDSRTLKSFRFKYAGLEHDSKLLKLTVSELELYKEEVFTLKKKLKLNSDRITLFEDVLDSTIVYYEMDLQYSEDRSKQKKRDAFINGLK